MIILLFAALTLQPGDKQPPDKGPSSKDAQAMPEVQPPVAQDTAAGPVWTLPSSMKLIQDGCAGPIDLTALTQDGTNVTNGSAVVFCAPSSEPLRGHVTGTFANNSLRLLIDWGCVKRPWPLPCLESAGVYEGAVDAEGRLAGFTFDVKNPDSRAAWRSLDALPRK